MLLLTAIYFLSLPFVIISVSFQQYPRWVRQERSFRSSWRKKQRSSSPMHTGFLCVCVLVVICRFTDVCRKRQSHRQSKCLQPGLGSWIQSSINCVYYEASPSGHRKLIPPLLGVSCAQLRACSIRFY